MDIYIFTFTFCVLILNIFKVVSIITGHEVTFPFYWIFNPTDGLFFYPSFLYQVYFWANKFLLLN